VGQPFFPLICLDADSGAPTPRQSIARREGWRISFVWGCFFFGCFAGCLWFVFFSVYITLLDDRRWIRINQSINHINTKNEAHKERLEEATKLKSKTSRYLIESMRCLGSCHQVISDSGPTCLSPPDQGLEKAFCHVEMSMLIGNRKLHYDYVHVLLQCGGLPALQTCVHVWM
jgi:hypothetical protein